MNTDPLCSAAADSIIHRIIHKDIHHIGSFTLGILSRFHGDQVGSCCSRRRRHHHHPLAKVMSSSHLRRQRRRRLRVTHTWSTIQDCLFSLASPLWPPRWRARQRGQLGAFLPSSLHRSVNLLMSSSPPLLQPFSHSMFSFQH